MLYKGIEIGTDEPVQFVGVYVLRWHERPEQPTMGFRPIEKDEVTEIAARAVDRIVEDLLDRRGLKQEWRQIDSDIQDEICNTWADVISQVFLEEGDDD